ncbi:ATP-binding protein [Rhizobium leguminosarum]|uniref:ATP-binding protein n=1 Tax=Rhizobium leguminosarum TaxID=384 RepID=UPI000FEC6674|nr:ATP-binding protein [Rhizobium leguminosarum]RWX36916.1 hypothetical protein EHI43_08480 [Rhizobium leguminosarum]
MAVSLSEATNRLLSGEPLSWKSFGEIKAGQIQLSTPAARRLFHFLLSSDKAKVATGSEDLFERLVAAWNNSSFDPASQQSSATPAEGRARWRLARVEAGGFGGLNLLDGPPFMLAANRENWCLEGQNGSGKTSIASAIIWALTGYRCRDQDGLVKDDGRRIPVFNDSGVQIGDWPPTVAFPPNALKLAGTAEAWVRLSFQDDDGNTAEAFRRLIAAPVGEPQFESGIDPALRTAPHLIETGLLMPARLARIGFGEKSHSIYEAVKLLTGLDQLADIGEGAAAFSHKAKRFLKYGSDKGIQGIETKLETALDRATEEARKAGFVLTIADDREKRAYAQELRDLADGAAALAATHSRALQAEVAADIDTANPDHRARIRNAVSGARGILQQNVKGIPLFEAWAALKAAHADSLFDALSPILTRARSQIGQAIAWDKRQGEDARLRLKALAAQYFAPAGHEHEDAECPLCKGKLSLPDQKALAAELDDLKAAADAAQRKLFDACAAIEKDIRDTIPAALVSHFASLADMQPRTAFESAMRERFVEEAPFSTVLTGMADFAANTAAGLSEKLPAFNHVNHAVSGDVPAAAQSLLVYLSRAERVSALVEWWAVERPSFVDAWGALKGIADENSLFPASSLEGRLVSLEEALEKVAPLDDLAKALRDAAKHAEDWLMIQTGQRTREAIAEALEPLKDLRGLVTAETASSISALSGRMKSVLDRIQFRERLSFEDAALGKKSVQVLGSFDHGIRIDASTVANSSWLRAILWAFTLAMREQTIEALGKNPFPLMLLDDPQVTFDPRNKRKWAQELARIANADAATIEAAQLVLITHERQFFQLLVNIENLSGQQGLLARLNASSKVATVVNGHALAAAYAEAQKSSNDRLAYEYIADVRRYCEDLLKIMLRAEEPTVCDMTIGDLAKLLKERRDASVAPFSHVAFDRLYKTLSGGGGKQMKIINESHHVFDGTIGLAEAGDVKIFWETTLQSQIHTGFKVYAEYEAYAGEPRLFPWMDNVVSFPNGNAADLRKLKLVHTGIAAAARTDGRAGVGLIAMEDLAQTVDITLHNHDAYQLAAGTLDPVAGVGDVIITSNYAKINERNLVTAAFGDKLLARRYNETDAHPNIAVLTGQSVDPYVLAQPIIAPRERLSCRKIVGTLFAGRELPVPRVNANAEFIALSDFGVIAKLLEKARLFAVSGRSAEPIALDGQYLIARDALTTPEAFSRLDGRPVVAVDESGARYFKRMRQLGMIIVLESLNPDGISPSVLLSLSGGDGLPRLTQILEVVGVLFEQPA